MTSQLDLRTSAPRATSGDVQRLFSVLFSDGVRWMSARELTAVLSWNDRKIRAVAAKAWPFVTSAPASRGYIQTTKATMAEIDEVDARLASQIDAMQRKRVALRCFYHSRPRSVA